MKKSSLIIAVFALTIGAFSSFTSHAATCGTTDRTGSDPFGSCEDASGNVSCGSGGTNVPMVGTVIVDQNKGAQACADKNNSSLPIRGRVTAYKSSTNKVTLGVDGDDAYNAGGSKGWDRVDIDPNGSSKVCAWRGSGGTYWTRTGGHSTADGNVNNCAP